MAFLTLNDGRNNIDGVIFPDKFKQFETVLRENEIYVVYGKFEKRNQQVQLVVNYLATIDDFEENRIKRRIKLLFEM